MPDESEQIVIYPNRLRLLRYALLYLICALVAVGPMVGFTRAAFPPYSLTHPVQAVVGGCVGALLAMLIILLAALLLFTLYRILVHTPSVIATEDGIIDRCSLIAGGMGLLRWQEIAAILPTVYGKRTAFLVVIPRDPRAVLARRGPLARLFLRSITLPLPGTISLPQWLLSTTAGQLWGQICHQYRATLLAHRIFVPQDDSSEVR